MKRLSWNLSVFRIDFTNSIAQFRAVLKRMRWRSSWCNLLVGLVVCGAVPCSEQVIPQLLAQIASLDRDHTVSLHATSDGVDVILTHDIDGSPIGDSGESLAPLPSQPAHVVHVMSGPITAKQSTSSIVSNGRSPVPYFPTVTVTEWRTFVPSLPLAYSRPPPGDIWIVRLDRPALAGLLI